MQVQHLNVYPRFDIIEARRPRGTRVRYRCAACGHLGPWRINGNDAMLAAEAHLGRKHDRA